MKKRSDAKKKREPFDITKFTMLTVRYISYAGMVISVIVCLPLIAFTGCVVFIGSLIEGVKERNKDG